jgi:hypothetical protein
MTQVATTMRAAFEKAARNSKPSVVQGEIKSALRRKVGLVTRKTMWSIQRGNR